VCFILAVDSAPWANGLPLMDTITRPQGRLLFVSPIPQHSQWSPPSLGTPGGTGFLGQWIQHVALLCGTVADGEALGRAVLRLDLNLPRGGWPSVNTLQLNGGQLVGGLLGVSIRVQS
jgi:hypothetical protein